MSPPRGAGRCGRTYPYRRRRGLAAGAAIQARLRCGEATGGGRLAGGADPMTEWVLIAHGGARRLEPEEEPACRRGMAAALLFGVRVLSSGGSALDAVEAVVRALGDDATFNAGNGSVRNASGGVQMDASIMDGASLEIGAVVGLKTAGNPVSVARRLLKEKEILLAGEGAEAFVRHGEQGVLAEHSAAA